MRSHADRKRIVRKRSAGRALLLAAALLGFAALSMTGSAAAHARVLRVGSFHGSKGTYRTIQAAVDAARPGDWVLVGPATTTNAAAAPTRLAKRLPRPC